MEEYFKEALKEAYGGINSKEGGPFGAIVVHDGKIVGRGHNTVLKDKDSTKHAEINAISQASKYLNTHNLSNCQLYTTSYPCPMCLSACYWANISKIYYITSSKELKEYGWDDGYIYGKILKQSLKNIFSSTAISRKEIPLERVYMSEGLKLLEDSKGIQLY